MPIFKTDDPIADFARHDAEQEAWLDRRPECADCGHHIQDEQAFYINGEWICQDCMSVYLVEVGDYME